MRLGWCGGMSRRGCAGGRAGRRGSGCHVDVVCFDYVVVVVVSQQLDFAASCAAAC